MGFPRCSIWGSFNNVSSISSVIFLQFCILWNSIISSCLDARKSFWLLYFHQESLLSSVGWEFLWNFLLELKFIEEFIQNFIQQIPLKFPQKFFRRFFFNLYNYYFNFFLLFLHNFLLRFLLGFLQIFTGFFQMLPTIPSRLVSGILLQYFIFSWKFQKYPLEFVWIYLQIF